jgi:hypothetical protein
MLRVASGCRCAFTFTTANSKVPGIIGKDSQIRIHYLNHYYYHNKDLSSKLSRQFVQLEKDNNNNSASDTYLAQELYRYIQCHHPTARSSESTRMQGSVWFVILSPSVVAPTPSRLCASCVI